MTHEEERNKLIIGLFVIFLLVVVFILGLFIATRADRTNHFENKINMLEIKNRELIQASELSDVIRQLIPPQAWAELRAVAEELKQRKEKE